MQKITQKACPPCSYNGGNQGPTGAVGWCMLKPLGATGESMVPPYNTLSRGWKTRRWKRLSPGEQGESLVPPYTRGSYSLSFVLCVSVSICLNRVESRAGVERFQRLELFVLAARMCATPLMPLARRVAMDFTMPLLVLCVFTPSHLRVSAWYTQPGCPGVMN